MSIEFRRGAFPESVTWGTGRSDWRIGKSGQLELHRPNYSDRWIQYAPPEIGDEASPHSSEIRAAIKRLWPTVSFTKGSEPGIVIYHGSADTLKYRVLGTEIECRYPHQSSWHSSLANSGALFPSRDEVLAAIAKFWPKRVKIDGFSFYNNGDGTISGASDKERYRRSTCPAGYEWANEDSDFTIWSPGSGSFNIREALDTLESARTDPAQSVVIGGMTFVRGPSPNAVTWGAMATEWRISTTDDFELQDIGLTGTWRKAPTLCSPDIVREAITKLWPIPKEVTIGGFRYTANKDNTITKHWPSSGKSENYRRADNAAGYEFYSQSTRTWTTGYGDESIRQALETLCPIHVKSPMKLKKPKPKVEPFNGWLPAGEGAVFRLDRSRGPWTRWRRTATGLERQHRKDKRWATARSTEGPHYNAARAALDHFWPLPKEVPFPERIFKDSDGDLYRWVKGAVPGVVHRHWTADSTPSDVGWYRHEVPCGAAGLKEALDFYWPEAPTAEPFPAGTLVECVESGLQAKVLDHVGDRVRVEWTGYAGHTRIVDRKDLKLWPRETFNDRCGDVWHREGNVLVSNRGMRLTRTTFCAPGDKVGVKLSSIRPSWVYETFEALAPEWLDSPNRQIQDQVSHAVRDQLKKQRFVAAYSPDRAINNMPIQGSAAEIIQEAYLKARTAMSTEKTDKTNKIEWTFKCAPEQVDIARCLREAYEAGAREVTVDDGTDVTHYLHHTEHGLLRHWWFATTSIGDRGNSFRALTLVLNAFGGFQEWNGWTKLRMPCLAQARAWEAAEEAKANVVRKIRVTVKGTR